MTVRTRCCCVLGRTVRLLMKVDWGAYVAAVTSCAGTMSRFLRHPAQVSLAALSILNVSYSSVCGNCTALLCSARLSLLLLRSMQNSALCNAQLLHHFPRWHHHCLSQGGSRGGQPKPHGSMPFYPF